MGETYSEWQNSGANRAIMFMKTNLVVPSLTDKSARDANRVLQSAY